MNTSTPSQAEREAARAVVVRFVIHPYACPTNRDLASPCSCGRIANIDTLIAQAKAEAVEPLAGMFDSIAKLIGEKRYREANVVTMRGRRIVTEARHALSTTEAPEAPAGER